MTDHESMYVCRRIETLDEREYMKSSQFLYVANWKMQFSFEKTLSFYRQNKKSFEVLAESHGTHIILCPSFDVLYAFSQEIKNSSLSLGAQSCSSYQSGAYTGEVSAESLSQVGCTFCIVGHSERRRYFSEKDKDVALKLERLLENNLYPIVCVGETKEERNEKRTAEVIERQVRNICETIQREKESIQLCIAYEPVWSIGTGVSPLNKEIEAVFSQIQEISQKTIPGASISLLYGGSVNEDSAAIIKNVCGIKGFLIGGASLDFQKFEKIVT